MKQFATVNDAIKSGFELPDKEKDIPVQNIIGDPSWKRGKRFTSAVFIKQPPGFIQMFWPETEMTNE